MNIFVLDADPYKAAHYQCDKHVVKMVTETAQLLCTFFSPEDSPPYKRTHMGVPVQRWTVESAKNYVWMLHHGKALAEEYTFRYKKVHKSEAAIKWCIRNIDLGRFDRKDLTPFVQTMPDEFRQQCTVSAYRHFYNVEKRRFAVWNNGRNPPFWWWTDGPDQ